ncbi:ClpS-like protein [Basidiobolus meristosporus CBS 931.73]|uniref:ClpS-like protein n=1 Tax=Basidiobolus meristosporus CBS 931.73 TaxID=1314790 RepID=A0A1Y1ZB13_9FUNG|nr:ClpS-like protein [Basidiobolus meristosporus CBS 931.73]|eukprot:ORY07197.1 ClpS-like protein [Basidiobolus meristosporus CBS 931.73]
MAFALQTRVALRTITRQAFVRQASRSTVSSVLVSRHSYSTEAAPTPGESKDVSPKITKIVDEISGLTLLETADLVKLLKEKLNIQDIAAPVMQVAAAAAPAGAAPAEEEKAPEKTMFNVKLDKFDAASKAKIIREIKGIIPGCNLVEAKKFVESAPKVIKENVPKEEAEALKKTLEALGATIVME